MSRTSGNPQPTPGVCTTVGTGNTTAGTALGRHHRRGRYQYLAPELRVTRPFVGSNCPSISFTSVVFPRPFSPFYKRKPHTHHATTSSRQHVHNAGRQCRHRKPLTSNTSREPAPPPSPADAAAQMHAVVRSPQAGGVKPRGRREGQCAGVGGERPRTLTAVHAQLCVLEEWAGHPRVAERYVQHLRGQKQTHEIRRVSELRAPRVQASSQDTRVQLQLCNSVSLEFWSCNSGSHLLPAANGIPGFQALVPSTHLNWRTVQHPPGLQRER